MIVNDCGVVPAAAAVVVITRFVPSIVAKAFTKSPLLAIMEMVGPQFVVEGVGAAFTAFGLAVLANFGLC